jgi:hypothetical protein
MPFNGLSGAAYYRSILGVDPFQETEKYPPSNTSVTLTEDVNFKITHPTNQEAARMGVSLSLSGDGRRLLVGMPQGHHWEDVDRLQTAGGRAQAYEKQDTTWQGPILPPFPTYAFEDGDGTEKAGEYVSISRNGTFAAMSTYGIDLVGVITDTGKTVTINTDNEAGPVELNADGHRIVVGMPNGGPSNEHGRVTVYGYRDALPTDPNGGADYYIVGQSLTGTGNNDHFGADVAINDIGNIIAVAIPGSDIAGSNQGAVKVYILQGNIWTQLGQTLDVNSQLIVTAIDMDSTGYIVAVGAGLNQPVGANEPIGEVVVYKYNKSTSTWDILGNKIANFTAAGVQIGRDVRLSADGYTLVASNGASDAAATGTLNETVGVYRYNGLIWKLVGSFVGSGNSVQNGFSLAISSDGKTIVSGSPGTNSDFGEIRHHTLNL